MNQRFTNVKAALGISIFWLAIIEGFIWMIGKIDTQAGWLPFAIMVTVFGLALAGLNWLTSESR